MAFLPVSRAADPVVYSYPETALSDAFRIRHITKTVYVPGKMKLYYKGANLQGAPVRCFDANFEDLGGEFEPVFEKGVLTIQADFAERISGLEIEDRDYDVIYRLRYLDSPQFAWLADLFWYDYGWMKTGDTERYYSEDELEAQAKAKQSAKNLGEPAALFPAGGRLDLPGTACGNGYFPWTRTGHS